MERTKSEKKVFHNTFSPERFVKLFAALESLVVFLYVKYGATFSVYENRLRKLIVLSVILGIVNILFSIRRARNWISLIVGICIPVLSYEVASMWKYSDTIRGTVIIGMGASFLMAFLWSWYKSHRIKKPKIRRSVLISRWEYLNRILCTALLLAVCVYGKVLIRTHYTVSTSDIEYILSNSQNDVPDYENSLSANIAAVAKMDPDGGWAELSADEKMEVLQTICRIECRYLGMRDSAPSLELSYLEEGLLGQYNHEEDKITLSYNYVVDTNASAYSICQVLCHEMYHRYQRYQVNMLEAIRNSDDTAKYANLLLLYGANIYEEEMNNYITPTESSGLSYYFYYSQQLERDAEKYGNEAVSEYYEKIQDYLEKN